MANAEAVLVLSRGVLTDTGGYILVLDGQGIAQVQRVDGWNADTAAAIVAALDAVAQKARAAASGQDGGRAAGS